MADPFRHTVRAILRAMSRQGVMREAERENLLQVMRECPDELFTLVESLILRETDAWGKVKPSESYWPTIAMELWCC